MQLSPFALFTIVVLSSSISSSSGFSTSKLISSSAVGKSVSCRKDQRHLKRASQPQKIDRGIVLLHVATDPTTAASQTDEDDGSSYDFISVKEAEERLRQERSRYEGERSDLEWLLDVQRRQLQELSEGRRGKENAVDMTARKAASRIVILGAHAHVDARSNRRRGTRSASRNNANGDRNRNNNDGTYQRMGELENLLQNAIMENEKLTRQLRENHHQYSVERSMYEEELREERGQLNYVRDELHMERAYFETSRRMLEQLIQEEQQKVQQLEKELMMMISHEQAFSQEDQSQEAYQQELDRNQLAQNQQQAQQQQQQQQQQQMQSQINNQKRRRGRAKAGFTMNINDVQCPLYP
eukprot:CAMPEP_0116156602 /NCGR_PEP_ID=MMETSP0329-20121206/22917_1 /TAXON_ID=697910 /ORGANISM="Pseudo-nitzschia arenysensis, Strain B593" /LENGTH=354 /DNA_ID=CAMNT_0003653691 /DNA_START=147 /DNA_END=1211 /DNA_ORIENTATION=+